MNISRDIQPMSNFKRQPQKLLQQLRDTGEPVILTSRGEPAAVLLDVASYQELVDLRDRVQAMIGVREGLDDMKAGRSQSLEETFRDIVDELRD
ncbi:MAG: type II toxin-antitoxin system Phd/YefM family antitoxin [Sumerlaeia bacterium]